MRYMGGKFHLAKKFLPIVLADRKPGQYYAEPFLGGANVLPHVDGPRMAGDSNADLMALYWYVQRGGVTPSAVTEEEYRECKDRPLKHAPWPRAFIGHGCSFGGKLWGGYAGVDARTGISYAAASSRSLAKLRPALQGVSLSACDYWALPIPPRSIIYCDPPYAGTTGYGAAFDSAKFWQWAGGKAEDGHSVFVSEYQAPEGWDCVWEYEHRNSVRKKAGSPRPIERLFTRRAGK